MSTSSRPRIPTLLCPIDLVTTTASGLDPHISPAAALFQVPRVAKDAQHARRIVCASWSTSISKAGCSGFLGEPRVNVLALNLALDRTAVAVEPTSGRAADQPPARARIDRWRISGLTQDQRPSPEALLAEARREEKGGAGRLKIFVGAAPGVGKTYEMLETARAKLKEGVDVVVGVVETHGRKETEALLEGFEILPRKPTIYVNRILDEFDIDAALEAAARPDPGRRARPHQRAGQPPPQALPGRRGAAGCRHRRLHHRQHPAHREPERRRGADHARARARDRARRAPRPRRRHQARRPDAGRADPAPEGGQGLRAGAGRACAQALLLARQPHGAARAGPAPHRGAGRRAAAWSRCRRAPFPGPWAAGERILVCVSEDPRSAGLVRHAKRLADRLHAPWTALCVETSQKPAAQRGGARPDRRAPCAWPSASTARPSRFRRRRGASPTTSSASHRRTTSRTSSSASRRARAGSRSCTALSCTT